jgi:hypothetical protein
MATPASLKRSQENAAVSVEYGHNGDTKPMMGVPLGDMEQLGGEVSAYHSLQLQFDQTASPRARKSRSWYAQLRFVLAVLTIITICRLTGAAWPCYQERFLADPTAPLCPSSEAVSMHLLSRTFSST